MTYLNNSAFCKRWLRAARKPSLRNTQASPAGLAPHLADELERRQPIHD